MNKKSPLKDLSDLSIYAPSYMTQRKGAKIRQQYRTELQRMHDDNWNRMVLKGGLPFPVLPEPKTLIERLNGWSTPKLELCGDVWDAVKVQFLFRLDCARLGFAQAKNEITDHRNRYALLTAVNADIQKEQTFSSNPPKIGAHLQLPQPPYTTVQQIRLLSRGFLRGLVRPSLDYFRPLP